MTGELWVHLLDRYRTRGRVIKVLTQIWPHKHTSVSGLRDVTFQSSDPPNVYTLVREKPSSKPREFLCTAPTQALSIRSSSPLLLVVVCLCDAGNDVMWSGPDFGRVRKRTEEIWLHEQLQNFREEYDRGYYEVINKDTEEKKEKTKQQQTRHTVRSQLRRLKTQTQDRSEHHLQMYSCHHKIDGVISHFFLGAACCQVVTGTACDLRIVGSKPCCISVKKRKKIPLLLGTVIAAHKIRFKFKS